MDENTLKIIDGQLPNGEVGQWVEASFDIKGPHSFGFLAAFCRREGADEFCQYTFGVNVPAAFDASLALTMLRLSSRPPLEPSRPNAILIAPHAKVVTPETVKELGALLSGGVEAQRTIPSDVVERLVEGRRQIQWYMRMAASGTFR